MTTKHTAQALTASLLLALVLCAPARPATTSYGWPVAPFGVQHPLRGTFGDPRTVFNAPPTLAGLYAGRGSFSFHMGIDICGPDGTAVYPVVDGTVVAVDSQRVVVDCAGGRRFEYWHIRAAVRVGQRVTARKTVLGRILRGSGHVHLSELADDLLVNPLLPGHLTPYRDTTAPQIASIGFHTTDAGPALMPGFIRGSVTVLVRAHDLPADVRGNRSTASLVFTVHNSAGWVGV